MIAMLHFATLVVITALAVATALAFDWLLLRATFLLMQPATAKSTRSELVRGTVRTVQAFAARR